MSSSLRGESETVSAFGLPPPQPGRRVSSSGRAVPTTSSGTPDDHSTRWSTKSSRWSSAQCKSSKTRTSGRSSARPSKKRRQAVNASSRASPEGSAPPASPTSGLRCDSIQGSETASESLRAASASSSPSRIPACALTISPSAQKVTPSPYGRQRPCRQEIRSGWRSIAPYSSRTSRLFPIPGTPTSVTSCGERSPSVRASASSSSATSRVRPTSAAPWTRSTPTRARACTTSHACTGSALPFATTGSASL